jgi:SAM-dependent methyltransferase
VLGHSEREIERLKAQAQRIDPTTRRFLQEAGLAPGMRVLDVGSGAGDVAFIAAELVGMSGEVVGVDRSAAVLDVARERAAEKSLRQVSFVAGDPTTIEFDRPFDAVIGRYVLQFQRSPDGMLRRLAACLRPGGLVMFHEIDWGGLRSFPPVPTFDRCCQWGAETMRLHGTETRMGSRLHETFVAAGLGAPSMREEAPIGSAAHMHVWLQAFRELMSTLLPEMQRHGIATGDQLQLDTLVERIVAEAEASASILVGHYQIAAWIRLPS